MKYLKIALLVITLAIAILLTGFNNQTNYTATGSSEGQLNGITTIQLPDTFKGRNFDVQVAVKSAYSTGLADSLVQFQCEVKDINRENATADIYTNVIFYDYINGIPVPDGNKHIEFTYYAVTK